MTATRPRLARSDATLLVMAAAVVMSVALAVAAPHAGSLDDRARTIERQLRCPTCQSVSIADSPATSATQMRALVREQLVAGSSDDAVRAFFVARYGRWILLDPTLSGPDLALWLVPALILAGGALLVVRRARGREAARSSRTWRALPPVPAPRFATLAVGGAMVLALAVPIVAAVGPRLTGSAVSGGRVSQTAPTIEDLEAFVRAEPRDAEVLVALGDALLTANRAGEAADRYKAALVIDPENVRALIGVGTILLGADRPDAAGPVLDRVLALDPDQPDALLYRAVARLRLEGAVTDQVRLDISRFLEVTAPDDPRRAMAAGLVDSGATLSPSDLPTIFPSPGAAP